MSGLSREGAPDYHEPFLGWRVWLLREDEVGIHLSSVFYEARWPPASELEAVCLQHPGSPPTHTAPAAGCECGIYAARDVETLGRYLERASRWRRRKLDRVLGLAHVWGRVLTCKRGWRASHAYPAQLYIPVQADGPKAAAHEAADALRYAYRVPTDVLALPRGISALDALPRERHAA